MTFRTAFIAAALAALAFAAVPASSADMGLDFSFRPKAYHYAVDSSQEALGIFPFNELRCVVGCVQRQGYFVAGRLRLAGETRDVPAILVLDNDGNPDTSIGEGGWIVKPAYLNVVSDVAYDAAHRRMYFVGTRLISTFNVYTVVCVDVDLGNACSGFGLLGSGVAQWQYESTAYSSTGERIVFDPDLGLFVTGNASSDNGDWVGVARLDPVSGERINEFSGDGSRLYSYQPRLTSNSIRTRAMALSPTAATDGKRHLYLGGEYRANPDVHDSARGFVIAINPVNGNGIGNFGGDNTAWRQLKGNVSGEQTYVLAMNVQANGKLTIFGRDEYTSSSNGTFQRRPIFARLQADGAPDPDFCIQTHLNFGCSGVQGQTWGPTTHNRAAILERPDNRDLVFFFTDQFKSTDPVRGYMLQASSNAHRRIGLNSLSSPVGKPEMANSYPYAAAWNWSGSDRIVFAGSYFNSDTRLLEFAVVRLMNDDTIFADAFGGPRSD